MKLLIAPVRKVQILQQMHANPIVKVLFVLSAIYPPYIPQVANAMVKAAPARIP